MKKLLIIDGMNFLHRARSGFTLGSHAVSYNFFRNLRALIEITGPTRVMFVLEGTPRDRLAEHPEYKANRVEVIDILDSKSVKRAEELKAFFKQCEEVVSLMKRAMPIVIVRHAHYECDDVIYTLCKRSAASLSTEEVVVASNDTDFIQLLNEFPTLKLWNPHDKAYVDHPGYDYVTWKALRGDPTDNIPNLPGVGNVTAEKAMGNLEAFNEIVSRPGNRELFERNMRLIKLKEIPADELGLLEVSETKRDWLEVISDFKEWGFKSIFKDKTWEKFKSTFDVLE